MKKFTIIFIALLLVFALCFSLAACSPNVIENPNNSSDNDNDDTDEDDTDEDENNNDDENGDEEQTNPYQSIIDDILVEINNMNGIEDYVAALTYIMQNIPVDPETLTTAAGDFVGSENVEMVDEYYTLGTEMLNKASTIIPLVPQIKEILDLIDTYGDSIPQVILNGAGIDKDGDTYSFTYEDTEYDVQIDDNTYTVSFNDKTIDLKIEDDETYQVIENNKKYLMDYNESNDTMAFTLIDLEPEEETDLYTFETAVVDNDLAMQFYDIQNQKVAQFLTDISVLEATVSIQEEVTESPLSIINGLPSDFATEGDIYIINEGVVEEYL